MRPRVYVAGPMDGSGDFVENMNEAFDAAQELFEAGFAPFIPHTMTLWAIRHPKQTEEWYELDHTWVLSCDCLLRLPGESKGADGEVELARENGIPVFEDVKSLIDEIG